MLCLIPLLAFGQTPDAALFAGADQARAAAEAANAAVLSPRTFSRAVADYDAARRDLDRGKDAGRVQKRLAQAELEFREALENSEIAALTLRDEIESRAAAVAADAAHHVPEDMAEADKLFAAAAATLEKGDLNGAQETGELANEALRLAELNAIRTQHLAVARSLLAQARQAKTDRFAPLTTAKAEDLLNRADALLVTDRYDVNPAIDLALQAEYEARHAMYIGGLVEQVRNKELSPEEIILDWESALIAIAAALEFEPDFSAGHASSRDAIIGYANELPELRATVAEQNVQILGLEDEIRELDSRLGGAAEDRDALIRKVERQARIREQFGQVKDTFEPDEAIVLRDGDKLIIRLVGLNFASNSANLDPSSAPLMAKVEAAIAVFPQCTLTVEGHTDSIGKVERNQTLSEDRATSVMNYMTGTLRIPSFRIAAVGYGDSRPVASNRTDEGRAQNRRIDLIITPRPDSL